MKFFQAGGLRLASDFCGKIDFVVRRSDARTEHHDQIGRSRAEFPPHAGHGLGEYPEFGALFPGVKQAHCPGPPVGKPDRAAIGHVNAQHFAGLDGNHAIDSRNHRQSVARQPRFRDRDPGNAPAVDLLGPPPAVAPEILANHVLVHRTQQRQGFVAVGGRLDAFRAADPARPEAGQAVDGI